MRLSLHLNVFFKYCDAVSHSTNLLDQWLPTSGTRTPKVTRAIAMEYAKEMRIYMYFKNRKGYDDLKY